MYHVSKYLTNRFHTVSQPDTFNLQHTSIAEQCSDYSTLSIRDEQAHLAGSSWTPRGLASYGGLPTNSTLGDWVDNGQCVARGPDTRMFVEREALHLWDGEDLANRTYLYEPVEFENPLHLWEAHDLVTRPHLYEPVEFGNLLHLWEAEDLTNRPHLYEPLDLTWPNGLGDGVDQGEVILESAEIPCAIE
jgi:hypothetical protein